MKVRRGHQGCGRYSLARRDRISEAPRMSPDGSPAIMKKCRPLCGEAESGVSCREEVPAAEGKRIVRTFSACSASGAKRRRAKENSVVSSPAVDALAGLRSTLTCFCLSHSFREVCDFSSSSSPSPSPSPSPSLSLSLSLSLSPSLPPSLPSPSSHSHARFPLQKQSGTMISPPEPQWVGYHQGGIKRGEYSWKIDRQQGTEIEGVEGGRGGFSWAGHRIA
eukprot:768772-Hanusia_phi.AAC.15